MDSRNEASMTLEAPPGYFVLTSPNDGETGTYTCPHDGCDGVVCGSIDDCHTHHKEWHSPWYSCAECGASFAAFPALSRHIKASGHQRWACRNHDCEWNGIEFDGYLGYHAHVMSARAHGYLTTAGEDRDDVHAEHGRGDSYDDGGSDVDMSDGPSECPSADEFVCIEACCSQYMKRFLTDRLFDMHVNSKGHRCAVAGGESLLQQGLPTADLEAKQEAMREFRCAVEGCPSFGHCLSTSHSYFYHIQTSAHLFPRKDVDADDDPDVTGDEDEQPKARRPSCVVRACPQYGRQFSHHANHERHINSAAHLRAARRSPTSPIGKTTLRRSPRSKPSPPVEKTVPDDEARDFWRVVSSAAASPIWPGPSPSAPVVTPTKSATPYTPLSSPSSTAREAYLERRNRELEDELRRLQAYVDLVGRRA
ncbi:Uncharacterized protein TCAP_04177 [Tolypocladium capitatum]|uniref:C2H2-type domain-containing protein n=1 Tax=Tolypocladium capitatum TaxID=45235 RepID=A0A2K3QEB4_9HYPO|nr:Uncharacterized protein TCAP_04177 [Tolypocladium capitatum]